MIRNVFSLAVLITVISCHSLNIGRFVISNTRLVENDWINEKIFFKKINGESISEINGQKYKLMNYPDSLTKELDEVIKTKFTIPSFGKGTFHEGEIIFIVDENGIKIVGFADKTGENELDKKLYSFFENENLKDIKSKERIIFLYRLTKEKL